MIQILVILISLAAIGTELFSAMWGWLILAVPSVFLFVTFFIAKLKKWKKIPELSATANQLLHRFGHYYVMPFTGHDVSASASSLMLAGVAVAIISAIRGFWWGIGIGIINFILMGLISRAFNPTRFLADDREQKGHEEIMEWITKRRKSGRRP